MTVHTRSPPLTEKVWGTGLHIQQFLQLAVKHQPQIEIDYIT